MRLKCFFVIYICFSFTSLKAQDLKTKSEDSVFVYAEQMPVYKGGMDGMYNFIKDNLVYPKLAQEFKIEGRVILTFIVAEDGKIKEVTQVGKKLGWGCDEEAIRVLKIMPNWEPGRIKGKPVSVKFTIPMYFRLK